NLGLLLRTADAAGVEAVVVAGERTDPLHRNCVRAARGAVGRLPIFRAPDLPAWAAHRRAGGLRVLGATAHGDVPLYAAELPPPPTGTSCAHASIRSGACAPHTRTSGTSHEPGTGSAASAT